MLSLQQITLSRGNKILLENASVMLYEKQKVGLIGHNGCGKSTLFELLLGIIQPDAGEFQLNPQLRISHLAQHLPDSEQAAIDFVLGGDEKHMDLLHRLAQAEIEKNSIEIAACHDALNLSGGYSKKAEAATIMAGLGFTAEQQQESVNSFSGGWRMRLNLARCLMKPADLLLLDEPTNHLDMEAIFWLERYLKQSPATIVLISHDREFLDAFVTHILHVHQKKLTLYSGDYSTYEKTHAQQLALQQAMHEKQQNKINHMMSFVNRFKAKATKAKQAQGRLKAIARLEVIAAAQVDSPFSFEFFPCQRASSPLLQCNEVDAGYTSEAVILKKINLTLNPGDRIALLGPNGQGKSTLIKTLTQDLPSIHGSLHCSAHLRVGYYAQHQLEQLDCNLSPVATIQRISPEAREQTIRDFLGGFNFNGDMAMEPIHYFSGGEKARLALAQLVWQKPNLLLLDEPTNHLDLGMRAAIEIALQSYEGAIILISHDRHLLRTTVDDFYLVHNQKVQAFNGDLDDYHQWLLTKDQNQKNQPLKTTSTNLDYKERKTLQNRLKKLEQLMGTYQKELHQLDHELTDNQLYEENNKKNQLTQLLERRAAIGEKLLQTEEEWLHLGEQLEED